MRLKEAIVQYSPYILLGAFLGAFFPVVGPAGFSVVNAVITAVAALGLNSVLDDFEVLFGKDFGPEGTLEEILAEGDEDILKDKKP